MNGKFSSGTVDVEVCDAQTSTFALSPSVTIQINKMVKSYEQSSIKVPDYFLSTSDETIKSEYGLNNGNIFLKTRQSKMTEARVHNGDSGGGLFAYDQNGNPVLIGINVIFQILLGSKYSQKHRQDRFNPIHRSIRRVTLRKSKNGSKNWRRNTPSFQSAKNKK